MRNADSAVPLELRLLMLSLGFGVVALALPCRTLSMYAGVRFIATTPASLLANRLASRSAGVSPSMGGHGADRARKYSCAG